MKYRVTYTTTAKQDLVDLLDMLHRKSPTTVPRLNHEVANVVQQFKQFPYSYQRTSYPKIRRAVLRTCRYTIYFWVDGRTVDIVAILPQMIGTQLLLDRELTKHDEKKTAGSRRPSGDGASRFNPTTTEPNEC